MDSRDLPARSRRAADALSSVRRRLLRRRRPVAVVLIGVAVAASLRSVAPPAPETTTLLVAARDLPAGEAIAVGDLVETEVPPGVVPEGVAGDPVGRLLAAPLRRGEPVTVVRLVGPELAAAAPGSVAVPLRLSDAGQAALLTPGDRVDLVATDPQAGTTEHIARDATVLAVPEAASASDGALPDRLVVLAIPTESVHAVTSAAVSAFVTFAWASS